MWEQIAANEVTASMYIVNPLTFDKTTKKLKDLTSTHPSTQERIKILTKMANVDFAEYERAFKAVTNKSKSPVTQKMQNNVSWNQPIMGLASASLPAEDTPEIKIQKHRKTEDLLWKFNDYITIECSCKTKLKVPPEYKGQTITCPHCKTKHNIQN